MCLHHIHMWLREVCDVFRESVCLCVCIAAAFATLSLVHAPIVIVRQALCLSAGCVACVYKLLATSSSGEWWAHGCWWHVRMFMGVGNSAASLAALQQPH